MPRSENNGISLDGRIPELDGLRGIAIILVILSHNYFHLGVFTNYGWIGVDLFFVLSGFLITDILLKINTLHGIRNFYARRFLRIFPLYYAFLAIVFFALNSGVDPSIQLVRDNQAWYWLYLQNFLYLKIPEFQPHFVTHLWSLAVEEQFYVILPWIVLFSPKKLLQSILVLLTITVIIFRNINNYEIINSEFNYSFTFTRIDSLLIGAFLVIVIKNKQEITQKVIWVIAIVSLLILSYIFIKNQSFYFLIPELQSFGYTLIALFWTGVLLFTLKKKPAFLRNSYLKWLGKYSYGIYVFHWPILFLFKHYFRPLLINELHLKILVNTINGTSALIITLIISYLSFNFFEKKFLRYKKNFPYS